MSGQDNNHQWASLKKKTKHAIFTGVIVIVIIIVVSLLAKINDTRESKIPAQWKARLKKTVQDSEKQLTLAKANKDSVIGFHHILQANTFLQSAKNLVGIEALPKITNMKIDELEKNIEETYQEITNKFGGIPKEGPDVLIPKDKKTGNSKQEKSYERLERIAKQMKEKNLL